jgi:hypothetical protein
VSVEITDNLALVNATLNEYVRVQHKLTVGEVLEKKGRDLGIKLFEGFWKLRQKGLTKWMREPDNAVFSGPMFTLAKKRGWATKVRTTELEGPYASLYDTGQASKFIGRGKRTTFVPSGPGNRALTKSALLVAQELATRQRGVGLLGVSFLSKRWRNRDESKGGDYLVPNTSAKLGELSTIEQSVDAQGNGFFRITNKTPGVATMDDKLGIISAALTAVRQDMLVYFAEHAAREIKKQLNKMKPL